MTKFVEFSDTIHGAHVDSRSRKFEWKGLKPNPYTNEMMTLYEGDRNSFAEIIKVCSVEDKVCEGTESFHAELGDCLEADAISLYIRTKRKIKETVKEGVSGRHGSIFLCPREYTISTIKTPLANLVKAIEKKKALINRNYSIEEK